MDLLGARTDKALPAKPRVYAHDEDLIDEVDYLFEAGNWGTGVEHDPGLLIELFNLLNGPVQMRAGFLMHQNNIRAGAGEISQIALGLDIIKWTSSGKLVLLRAASTTSGPMVMLGTKRPSITSTWIRSAPACSTSAICCPRHRKSAERIEGKIWTMIDYDL